MKKRILVPLACLALHAHAATYYISSVSGDDSRSAAQARNATTPWRTIAKINSYFPYLQPGDSVLFERGETFYGQLDIGHSGTATAPIVVGAYGTGTKPVLTGFTTVTDWVSLGSGIWESAGSVSKLPMLAMVTVNNTPYAMGRYPNANAPNKGYLTISSHSGSTSITCAALPSSPDWDGARLVLRTRHWILDTSYITSHSGTTIQYNTPPAMEPINGYGFFIENSPKTLDQFGEWYYNPSTKKIRVFFGSAGPTSSVVKIASIDTVVRCYNQNYITFDNLSIQGANKNGFNLYSALSARIQNCDVSFCGNAGIDGGTDDVNLTIQNNLITDVENYGIDIRSAGDYQVVRNNTIKRIGLFPGMGEFGAQSRTAIVNNSSQNHLIEGNRIDSVGYVGIRFGGDYTVLKNNVISNFTLVVDDGGGIYTANQGGSERFGRKVLNNLIYNGIGAKEGTTSETVQQSSGIYTDDNSSGIEIAGNSVWNCGNFGLFVHNSIKINAHNNTFYNNDGAQLLLEHDNSNYPALRYITFKENIGFAKKADQDVARFYTLQDDISQWGSIDSNYYARPVDDDTTIFSMINVYTSSQVKSKYILSTWKPAYNKDAATHKSPKTFPITINPDDSIRFEFNPTNASRTVALDGGYMDVQKNVYSSSIVLPPYSSVVLMRTTAPTTSTSKAPVVSLTSPTANAGYTAPATISLSANASDSDGTISKVEFYNGTTLLATKTTAPYTFSWQNVAAGNYTLTAKATDNSGLTTKSTAVSISVVNAASVAPTVSLTSPKANTSYTAPASIDITANASDSDGTISKVEFYNGTTLLATKTTAPYTYSWSNVAAGNYSLTAKATDNSGLTTTSPAVSISVSNSATPKAPTVTLTSPAASTSYTAPAAVQLSATAADTDGTISKVEFYNGTVLLATVTTSPYEYSWQNVDAGVYSITAKATDNSGLSTTSAAVGITVKAAPKPPVVSLTSPIQSATYTSPATIEITAAASDSDGTISRVDFYNGSTLLATKTIAPYTYSWQNVDNGSYSLTAKATDNTGLTTTSAPVVVKVTDNVTMQLAPNPVQSTLYITITGLKKPRNVQISISSSSGSVMKNIRANTGGGPISVNVSSLRSGTYTVQATSGFVVLSGQFIKL